MKWISSSAAGGQRPPATVCRFAIPYRLTSLKYLYMVLARCLDLTRHSQWSIQPVRLITTAPTNRPTDQLEAEPAPAQAARGAAGPQQRRAASRRLPRGRRLSGSIQAGWPLGRSVVPHYGVHGRFYIYGAMQLMTVSQSEHFLGLLLIAVAYVCAFSHEGTLQKQWGSFSLLHLAPSCM